MLPENKKISYLIAFLIYFAKDERAERIVFYFFLMFLFFMPLYEAPKNIFGSFFIVIGLWVALRKPRSTCNKIEKVSICSLILISLSPFLAGIDTPFLSEVQRFFNSLNWAVMPLAALVLLISRFDYSQLAWSLRSICLGAVLSVIHAYFFWSHEYPELNSVGHVNQSALYLAFCCSPAMLLILQYKQRQDILLGCATLLAIISFQAPAKSLVAAASVLFMCLAPWLLRWILNPREIRARIVIIVLIFTGGFGSFLIENGSFGPFEGLANELDYRINSEDDPLSQRNRLVNTSIELASGSASGFGLQSFESATAMGIIEKAVINRGGVWSLEQSKYYSSTHGHNLFANVLVERGWIGVVLIASFLCVMCTIFIYNIRYIGGIIGFLTVCLIILAGLGQTTLHVEHGQLAFISLAICLKLIGSERLV